MQPDSKTLTPAQGRTLLRLAREALNEKFGNAAQPAGRPEAEEPEAPLSDPALQNLGGVFVTLKIRGQLRGCIGTLSDREPLIENVKLYALHAAFHDPRFRPLTANELSQVTIEVSVLTPPQPLSYAGPDDLMAKLRPQVDGVTIRKGIASATFLPQVWDQLSGVEDFLSQLCLKAGLPSEEWRRGHLEVSTYQVQHFEEP